MASTAGWAIGSSNQGSVFPGTTHTSSAICRAAGESLAARASTASRTVAGTVSRALASTSVTKNGLPPVMPCRPVAVRPALLASCATVIAELFFR